MTESGFIDRKRPPTQDEIQGALGTCFSLWERLISFIEKTYGVEGAWSTWGPAKSGWNLRYRRKGKSLTALYPQQGRILVQVVLGRVQAERALKLELGTKISRMLREAPQLRDGRWLFISVTSEGDAEDVEKMLMTKIRPPQTLE